MFNIKVVDTVSLLKAEEINAVSSDMLAFMTKTTIYGFKKIFFAEDGSLLPVEDVRKVLAMFERPADLFINHLKTINFLLDIAPGCIDLVDCTCPFDYVIDPVTGTAEISEKVV